jgi:dGTPase
VGLPASKQSKTLEGQIMRVADMVAYVNHDIEDAVRAGLLHEANLPKDAVRVLGSTSSARIGRMVRDVVHETQAGGMTEIRMSADVLAATLDMRRFLFAGVYENDEGTAEFKKAAGILGGLWEKVQERPEAFLESRAIEADGIDVATKDFLAGMTDRYAVGLFERLFIPKPWVGPVNELR